MPEYKITGSTPTGEKTVKFTTPNSLRGSIEAVPAFWRGTIRNAAVPILAFSASLLPQIPQTLIAAGAAGAFGWAIKKGVENHYERRETRLRNLFDRRLSARLDEAVAERTVFWSVREQAWNDAAVEEWHRRNPDGTPPPEYARNFTESVSRRVEWPYEDR